MRGKADGLFELGDIGAGRSHVPGLHRPQLLDGLSAERLLDGLDEAQQLDRRVVADIVEPIGRMAGAGIGARRIETRVGSGRAIEHPRHPLDDVVDVGEVALHAAAVEDLDRLTAQDRAGEQRGRHVRPPPRPVHGEEPQAGGGQIVEMAVHVGHELVGLLGGGVQADRVIDVVVHPIRQARVGPVDARAAGVDQMLDAAVAAAFEHVDEAHELLST